MTYPNIEKFNEIVGKTFARLYVKFPSPIRLSMEHFVGEGKAFSPFDANGLQFATGEAEFAFDCVNWLVAAGYVSGKPDPGNMVFGSMVLTAKGLETLKLIPESLSATLGDQLAAAIKNGSMDAARKLTAKTLSYGAAFVFTVASQFANSGS